MHFFYLRYIAQSLLPFLLRWFEKRFSALPCVAYAELG
nr:MAG TPA: hypothetical protein [Microviridae sp.]